MATHLVGLLAGSEETFSRRFLEGVNEKGLAQGVEAEMVSLGGTIDLEPPRHAIIFDRLSHRIPYYQTFLKSIALKGTVVVNDPFWSDADEPFFGYVFAHHLGIRVPRTIALPNKAYPAGIEARDLRNLRYPLDWEQLAGHVGLPALLRPNERSGDATVVATVDELVEAYDASGEQTMLLQQMVPADVRVRCVCIERRHVLPLPDDPLPERLVEPVTAATISICEALGYDIDLVELAIRDDTIWVTEFSNPVPDFAALPGRGTLDWAVDHISDLAVRYALRTGNPPPWLGEHRWWRFLRKRTAQPAPS